MRQILLRYLPPLLHSRPFRPCFPQLRVEGLVESAKGQVNERHELWMLH